MNEADEKALLEQLKKVDDDHPRTAYGFRLGFQSGMAHRDAQPVVAVNEQLLMALVMITDTIPFQFMGEVERDLTLSAIAAAKGGV